MGWPPFEVARTGLAEFMAAWRGFARFHGLDQRRDMTPAEARALRREIWGDDG